MNHIVLSGDSIFDNSAYVQQKQSVIEQLIIMSAGKFKACLVAVDGAITDDLNEQFDSLPTDATHLFISSGGNDALHSAHLLAGEVSTVFEAMSQFSEVVLSFQSKYRHMLKNAVSKVERVVVCTIYDTVPGYEKEPLLALKLFNEVILREAGSLGLPVIDLRLVFDHESDYSTISPIEPSEQGGTKIVDMIDTVIAQHDFGCVHSVIYKY